MARKVWILFDPFEPEEPRVKFTEPIDDYEYCFADLDTECEHGVKVDWQEAFVTVLTKPSECECKGWGCRKCCSSDAEIRQRQGVFS